MAVIDRKKAAAVHGLIVDEKSRTVTIDMDKGGLKAFGKACKAVAVEVAAGIGPPAASSAASPKPSGPPPVHAGMKARFGGVSKKKAFGFSVRLEVRPLLSLIEKLLALLVQKMVEVSCTYDPNGDDDAKGQEVIAEDVALCALTLVAGCRGFTVRADHIAFRLAVDPRTIGDSEILALAGHKGWIELRKHAGLL